MEYYLAVDIGASSGRHILGWRENGEILTKELYRFTNGVKESNGHLTWDIEQLFYHVKKGIDDAIKNYPIKSLSIDTWGVDYVLMNGDKEILPCIPLMDNGHYHPTEVVSDKIPALLTFFPEFVVRINAVYLYNPFVCHSISAI